MKIGQKVIRLPVSFCERGEDKAPKPISGRVVYIHPKERFHIVEFELLGGKLRESFLGTES